MPRDSRIRQELEYHREEHSDQREGKNKIHHVGKRLHSGKHAVEPLCDKSNTCGKNKGNQEQKANHQNKAEEEDPIPQNAQNSPPGLRLSPQIALSEVCSCPKTPDAPKSGVTTPIRGRDNTARWLRTRALNHSLHRFTAFLAEQASQLLEDLTVGGLLPENQSCDGDRYNQQWSKGENGIISECGAQGWRLILHPIRGGLFYYGKNFFWIHELKSIALRIRFLSRMP
jgi:hypothetical protein